MEVDHTTGPSTALPLSLQLTVKNASPSDQAGISNLGYWGFPVRPQTTYHGSFYAKASDASIGPVTVSLVEDESGKAISTTVPSLTSTWQQHEFSPPMPTLNPPSTTWSCP
jgi:alpha-N-arabinofuranosidase